MGNSLMGNLLIKTTKTFNVFMGLARMDISVQGLNIGTWDSDGQDGQEYKINLGTTWATGLNSADSCWLSFAKDDDRIQAGRFEWCWETDVAIRTSGERYTKRIQFQKPFKTIPKVTTAITHLNTLIAVNFSGGVSASNIDTQGFNLELESGSGKCRLPLKYISDESS